MNFCLLSRCRDHAPHWGRKIHVLKFNTFFNLTLLYMIAGVRFDSRWRVILPKCNTFGESLRITTLASNKPNLECFGVSPTVSLPPRSTSFGGFKTCHSIYSQWATLETYVFSFKLINSAFAISSTLTVPDNRSYQYRFLAQQSWVPDTPKLR